MIILLLIFCVISCSDQVRRWHTNFVCLKVKGISKKNPDPDPKFQNRIRGCGSEQMGPDTQHCVLQSYAD